MDPFRYAWWWLRLKIDPTIEISPEDKVDIASRSEGLAEHIFFDAGKKDNLTMAHVAEIIVNYLIDDVDCKNLNAPSSPQPIDNYRPPFLKKITSAFVRQIITNEGFPSEDSNGNLHDAFIDAGILSELERNKALSQKDLDELLHVLIWPLSPGQKIALALKIPRMAEKILFTRQLKLNLKDTDLAQIIDHYAHQANSQVMTTLKRKKDLFLDALNSETLANTYIAADLLNPEQVIEILFIHSSTLVDKHLAWLNQKFLLAGDTSVKSAEEKNASAQLRCFLFEMLDEYCKKPAQQKSSNSDQNMATLKHIIFKLFEEPQGHSLRHYVARGEYPSLYNRINPHEQIEAISDIESSDSSLATTPRSALTPRDGYETPRSIGSAHTEENLTPRSSLSVDQKATGSRNTTPRIQHSQDREKSIKYVSLTGKIALELLQLIDSDDKHGLNNYLRNLKGDPDKLNALFDLALMRNLPDGLTLVELPKAVTKSLFTYDFVYPYKISDDDLISLFYKYHTCGDQEIIDQIFKYYSDIHFLNSGIVNGQLTFPNGRRIEKENYDAFLKQLMTKNLAPENTIFVHTLFSKYEYAKSLCGAPGIINTFFLHNSSISTIDGNEQKIRDNEAIKKYFPLLLKAAMNDPDEAKVFIADSMLMSLLKKALADEYLLQWECWRYSRLPIGRTGIKNELHNLILFSSRNHNKDFFENGLIKHLLLNSFSTVKTEFSSQDDMLSCISNITPIKMQSPSKDHTPYKQDYLAVVNITFTNSEAGNKAKLATALALNCSIKDLDDSFILMPVKDVHSFLPEKLSMNGVTPGLYHFETLLEWDTPEKFAGKPLDAEAFKNFLNTDKDPKPKSKLLIPQPYTEIATLSKQFNDDPNISITSGHNVLTSYTQTIITHFTAFITAIRNYISVATTTADKPLKKKNEPGNVISAGENLVKDLLDSGQTFFSPAPLSSSSAATSLSSSTSIPPSTEALVPPAAATARIEIIDDQNTEKQSATIRC